MEKAEVIFGRVLGVINGKYHEQVTQAGLWKKAVQGYLASIYYADAMMGEWLDALDKSEHGENTIVVIFSDHGWQLGEKHHWHYILYDGKEEELYHMKHDPEEWTNLANDTQYNAVKQELKAMIPKHRHPKVPTGQVNWDEVIKGKLPY